MLQESSTDPSVLDAVIKGLTASSVWVYAFTIVAYTMTAICVFGAIRRGHFQGRWRSKPLHGVVTQLATLAFFVGMLWAVESWATFRTPYYAYATQFKDLIPRFPWDMVFPRL